MGREGTRALEPASAKLWWRGRPEWDLGHPDLCQGSRPEGGERRAKEQRRALHQPGCPLNQGPPEPSGLGRGGTVSVYMITPRLSLAGTVTAFRGAVGANPKKPARRKAGRTALAGGEAGERSPEAQGNSEQRLGGWKRRGEEHS